MKIVAVGALCITLSACAGGPFEWRYGRDKIIPGQFAVSSGPQGSVLTWPSHAVGAVVYPNGQGACIQSAQSAKARNDSGSGSLGAKLTGQGEASLQLQQAIVEAVATLQDKNDVATFADVSMFQICTIAENNHLSPPQVVELVKAVMTASVEIAKARPTTIKVNSQVSPEHKLAPQKPPPEGEEKPASNAG